jgi:hypothetical protein
VAAVANVEPVPAWVQAQSKRDALAPTSFGAVIDAGVAEGVLSQAEAEVLVRSLLTAGCGHDGEQAGRGGQRPTWARFNLEQPCGGSGYRTGPRGTARHPRPCPLLRSGDGNVETIAGNARCSARPALQRWLVPYELFLAHSNECAVGSKESTMSTASGYEQGLIGGKATATHALRGVSISPGHGTRAD